MNQANLLFLLILAVLASSCGLMQTVAVNTTADVFYDGMDEVFTETSWEGLKKSLPGPLKTVETLAYVDPKNEAILATLVTGHAGQAFAINETEHYFELLRDSGKTEYKDKATLHYSKALSYGFRYLKEKGVTYQEMLKVSLNEKLKLFDYIDDHLSKGNARDKKVAFFTAQAWSGLINLNRKDPLLISQLDLAKGLYDWICHHEPNYVHGSCDLFYGAYEAGRPKTLGGNPKKGKGHFLKAIKAHPDNLLARVLYLQFYVLPYYDESGFKKEKAYLLKAFSKFDQTHRIWDPSKKFPHLDSTSNINLYNSIAKKRFEAIIENEKELF